MFSAYDIKKIIPRAVFALVAINLSWSLMDIFMQTIDLMGDSIQSLIRAPFGSLDLKLQFGSLITLALGFVVAGAGLGLIPVVGVLVAGMIGILSAFAIVLLRRVALIGLVMFAPLAIAFGILPQTESWFKKWWEWFSRLSLMYPFIMAMFAVSQVAANILSNSTDGGITGLMLTIGAIGVLFAPYFLFGKALSFAGSTVGKLAGVVNNRNKGLIDRTKKWEQGKVTERRADAKSGNRYGGRNAFTRGINRTLRAGYNPTSVVGHEGTRDTATLSALERNIAGLEERNPGLKGATKEEIAIGALITDESEAGAIIESKARQLAAKNGTSVDFERTKLNAAYKGWKDKAGGSVDAASATWALRKAAELGAVEAPEAEAAVERIAGKLGGTRAAQGRLGEVLKVPVESSLQKSGSVLGFAPPVTGASLGTMTPTQLADTRRVIDGIFEGDRALSFDALGKMNTSSANSVSTVKMDQVQDVLSQAASGTLTRDQAEQALKEHLKHALLLGESASKENNTAAAAVAADLVTSINAAINAHNGALAPGAAGPPTPGAAPPGAALDLAAVQAEAEEQAKARKGPLSL